MIRALSRKSVRAPLAIAMLLSWLVLSNHCALRLMAMAPASEHAACCGNSSGDGKSLPAPVRECCQSMQAIHPAGVVLPPTVATSIDAPVWIIADAESPVVAINAAAACIHETGPPEARSFADLVLRHGVRAHAPPILA